MPLSPEEEHRLVARAAQGAESAWDELYAQFHRRLRGVIRVRVPSDAEADEILQDAWTKLVTQLPRYDPARGRFFTFLCVLARSAMIDFFRRRPGPEISMLATETQNARREWDPDGTEEGELTFEAGGIGALDQLETAELYEALLRLTLALPSLPHELLSFGYCKLLEWKPAELASEGRAWLLADLERDLERRCQAAGGLTDRVVDACFAPLRWRLEQPLEELVEDARGRIRYRRLLKRVPAQTVLGDYFGTDPALDIAHWWYGVQRRLVHAAVNGGMFGT